MMIVVAMIMRWNDWNLIDVSISYAYTPTRIVSWCFPSNGENSLMHTSKPLELTFSNHTYTASLGFVARVYFAETNTKGLAAKL